MKKLQSVVFGVLLSTGVTATAGSYDIERFWASGDNWLVSYEEDIPVNPHNESFTITHDEVLEEVRFDFTWSEFQQQRSCVVGPHINDEGRSVEHVYHQAVELAKNADIVDFFHIASWAGVCYKLDMVQYRTDVTLVEFNCEQAETYWGQSVYVVGSSEQLGNWDPAKAIKLDPVNYPHWQKRVVVENNESLEWKCVKRENDYPQNGIEWEPGENHMFNSSVTKHVWGRF